MNETILFALLLRLSSVETPALKTEPEKFQPYLDSVRRMSSLYVEVGKEGAVVSSDADPLLLATIGFEESRHRLRPKDGDCQQTFGMPRPVCWSVGPMQLSRATTQWWPKIAPEAAPLTVELLRDPETNVRVAYRALRFWRDKCGGDLTATFSSWSAGKCLRSVGLGRRRCAIARALGAAANIPVPECSTRGRMDRRTQNFANALTKKDNP